MTGHPPATILTATAGRPPGAPAPQQDLRLSQNSVSSSDTMVVPTCLPRARDQPRRRCRAAPMVPSSSAFRSHQGIGSLARGGDGGGSEASSKNQVEQRPVRQAVRSRSRRFSQRPVGPRRISTPQPAFPFERGGTATTTRCSARRPIFVVPARGARCAGADESWSGRPGARGVFRSRRCPRLYPSAPNAAQFPKPSRGHAQLGHASRRDFVGGRVTLFKARCWMRAERACVRRIRRRPAGHDRNSSGRLTKPIETVQPGPAGTEGLQVDDRRDLPWTPLRRGRRSCESPDGW